MLSFSLQSWNHNWLLLLFFRHLKQEKDAEKAVEELQKGPKLDLGFKEGQTIRINISVSFKGVIILVSTFQAFHKCYNLFPLIFQWISDTMLNNDIIIPHLYSTLFIPYIHSKVLYIWNSLKFMYKTHMLKLYIWLNTYIYITIQWHCT